ncbi:PUA-like domain-containing protein [Apiosordaria backusii]|uniref:PUA-like domain-containing protein n=1 Tax=Apiosordaria backusii TaxID=314023 RepID=A0AA40DJE6_9PEZI|nr:PUA-like domain-containing protein [Apiosordaria backusii]
MQYGVPLRTRVIPPRRSPQMLANALAMAQNVQASASENAGPETPVGGAAVVETSTTDTAVADVQPTAMESAISGVNGAPGSPSIRQTSEPAEAPIEVWTGSPSDGVSQTRHLVVLYRVGRPPRPSDDRDIATYRRSVRAFFFWLESEAVIRPSFQDRLHLDQVLSMFDQPGFQGIPEDLRTTARALRQRFDEENWGRGDEGYASDTSNDNGTPVSPASSTAVSRPGQGVSNIRPPPPNHPIYGRDGIMHGVICYRSPRRGITYKLNPAYGHQKVNAAVIGHNGLIPGDWWPLQMVALFRGAHGKSQGGIFGSVSMGAYSIVVSGGSAMYREIDDDHGNVLYYSTDSKGVASSSVGTQALDRSRETREPVRVLRRAGHGASHRKWVVPACGIRYDGLYQVTGKEVVQQSNGDRWFRYTLRRMLNQQPDLQDIVGHSPTPRQINDYGQIKDGYPGAAI